MAAASMFQGRSSSHQARIEGCAYLLSDFQLACCVYMPAEKSHRTKVRAHSLIFLTTPASPEPASRARRDKPADAGDRHQSLAAFVLTMSQFLPLSEEEQT